MSTTTGSASATIYTVDFYNRIGDGAHSSAAAVVPRVVELVRPETVLDVGCGEGWWAAEFAHHGCDVQGVDGEHIDPSRLRIPHNRYQVVDLAAPTGTLHADLAVCLEVAEHLPATAADTLVANLVYAAPVVLFSAAVPGQTGVDHQNCQWPQYWIDKFAYHGYEASDCLRWEFWNDERVDNWYRQNMLLFASSSSARRMATVFHGRPIYPVIHPDRWPR